MSCTCGKHYEGRVEEANRIIYWMFANNLTSVERLQKLGFTPRTSYDQYGNPCIIFRHRTDLYCDELLGPDY